MKIKSLFGLIIFTLLAVGSSNAQSISKLNVSGAHAKFTPDASSLIFTTSNFVGLKKMDFSTSSVKVLSTEVGSGYSSVVLNDRVIFSNNEKKNSVNVFYFENSQLVNKSKQIALTEVFGSLGKNKSSLPVSAVSSSDLSSIEIVYADGRTKNILSAKDENKIWVSLSPDRTKILYTVSGRKTYVTDLKGNIIASIARAESPSWGSDNKIVFMITEDDHRGEYIMASDIYTFELNSGKSVKLTRRFDGIALYPTMSVDGSKVVFNSDKDELFLIDLKK